MDAVAELKSRLRARTQDAKVLILRAVRDERRPTEDERNQLEELQNEVEKINDELEAAYYRGGSDDGGGVREPVRPQPPYRGPGSAVESPRH
jgi:hypothetical protein